MSTFHLYLLLCACYVNLMAKNSQFWIFSQLWVKAEKPADGRAIGRVFFLFSTKSRIISLSIAIKIALINMCITTIFDDVRHINTKHFNYYNKIKSNGDLFSLLICGLEALFAFERIIIIIIIRVPTHGCDHAVWSVRT